jgi:hypothetical protein
LQAKGIKRATDLSYEQCSKATALNWCSKNLQLNMPHLFSHGNFTPVRLRHLNPGGQ